MFHKKLDNSVEYSIFSKTSNPTEENPRNHLNELSEIFSNKFPPSDSNVEGPHAGPDLALSPSDFPSSHVTNLASLSTICHTNLTISNDQKSGNSRISLTNGNFDHSSNCLADISNDNSLLSVNENEAAQKSGSRLDPDLGPISSSRRGTNFIDPKPKLARPLHAECTNVGPTGPEFCSLLDSDTTNLEPLDVTQILGPTEPGSETLQCNSFNSYSKSYQLLIKNFFGQKPSLRSPQSRTGCPLPLYLQWTLRQRTNMCHYCTQLLWICSVGSSTNFDQCLDSSGLIEHAKGVTGPLHPSRGPW